MGIRANKKEIPNRNHDTMLYPFTAVYNIGIDNCRKVNGGPNDI